MVSKDSKSKMLFNELEYPMLHKTPTPIRKHTSYTSNPDFFNSSRRSSYDDSKINYYTPATCSNKAFLQIDRSTSDFFENVFGKDIIIDEPPTTANSEHDILDRNNLLLPDEAPYALLEEEDGFFGNWDIREWARDLLACRYRQIIVTTTGMFAGYACMVVLQAKLKSHLNIPQNGEMSKTFTFAVSFQYIGNLIFRIAHNFFFACMTSPSRVLIAQLCMLTALSLLIMLFIIEVPNPVFVVACAYGLSGVAIGSFEGNLISAITPLGKQTKVWAITGIPLGFGFISIIGFLLMGLGIHPLFLYCCTFVANIIGLVVFRLTIPLDQSSHQQTDIIESFHLFREWAPQCFLFWGAFLIDMFFVASFGPTLLYIFNDHNYIPLFSPSSETWLVNHDLFIAVVNTFVFFGDFISRSVAYKLPHFDQPSRRKTVMAMSVLMSCSGGLLVLSKFGIAAPLGMMLIFFSNGMLYASCTRFVDMAVASQFNLIAISTWLLVGDIGSVLGSELIDDIRYLACGANATYPHVCHSTN